MAYNNSHSVILGKISSYLDQCCRKAYEQGRAEVIDVLLSKCNGSPNNNACLECSFAKWKDDEWDGCVIEQLKEQKNEQNI